ncbi:MAG: aminodeoxychorismate/anthranilate synthase component II [Spirochaetaceae bacterium]|jgi:anthranilate synthase component 2|nr:aminodeoxychorismate/anthranilate synthase component II [Spirochaetaceae bacterium]
MILLIDNYDSFSYNLYQLLGALNPDIKVVRNDKVSLSDIVVLRPSHLVLSPGPGRPKEAGICEGVIAQFGGKIPILGVCLGHQAIGEVYGAVIGYAQQVMHGKASAIQVDRSRPLFAGLPSRIEAGRYHSLVVDPQTVPDTLRVTAWTEAGEVMALEHREYPVYGVQFHPESVLTPLGPQILRNFLKEAC